VNEGDKRAVRVTIFGEEYSIRSDMGEAYTLDCAKYVDDAVQRAHVSGHVPEPHKAAILAALQITDEMFRSKAALETQTQTACERLTALRKQVDAATRA
jgi:cell division protein ZapA